MKKENIITPLFSVVVFLLSAPVEANYAVSKQLNPFNNEPEYISNHHKSGVPKKPKHKHLWKKPVFSKKPRAQTTFKIRPEYWLKIGPKKQFTMKPDLSVNQFRNTKYNLTNMVIKTNISCFNVDANASLDLNNSAKLAMLAKAGVSYSKQKYSVNAYQVNSFSISNKKSVSKASLGFGYEVSQHISTNVSLIQEFKPVTGSYLKSTTLPGARIALFNMAIKI